MAAELKVDDRLLAALESFALLYGALRWFHPSDQAASDDWDAVAVEGIAEIMRSGRATEQTLRDVFGPLAPTLALTGPGDPTPPSRVDAGAAVGTVHWRRHGLAPLTRRTRYTRFAVAASPGPYEEERKYSLLSRGRPAYMPEDPAVIHLPIGLDAHVATTLYTDSNRKTLPDLDTPPLSAATRIEDDLIINVAAVVSRGR